MADAITTDLADMFGDTVTVEELTGQDALGAPTYGTGVARSARVEGGGERRIDPDNGSEYVTAGGVIFAGAYAVERGDRLTLPADFDPQQVIVRESQPIRDENGVHHDEVFF